MCKIPAISDIVILVDGSWSIGRINFRLVRSFLENLVKAFSVDIDKTRIGEELLCSQLLELKDPSSGAGVIRPSAPPSPPVWSPSSGT